VVAVAARAAPAAASKATAAKALIKPLVDQMMLACACHLLMVGLVCSGRLAQWKVLVVPKVLALALAVMPEVPQNHRPGGCRNQQRQ